MPAGRPTKYSKEILESSREYLEGGYLECEDVIPSIEGLSLYIKIRRSTIYDWRNQEGKEEFSDILDEILAKQASLCVNQGLKGEFNPTIAKLVLGKHGYSEKQETAHTGPDGGPVQVQDVSFTFNPVSAND